MTFTIDRMGEERNILIFTCIGMFTTACEAKIIKHLHVGVIHTVQSTNS